MEITQTRPAVEAIPILDLELPECPMPQPKPGRLLWLHERLQKLGVESPWIAEPENYVVRLVTTNILPGEQLHILENGTAVRNGFLLREDSDRSAHKAIPGRNIVVQRVHGAGTMSVVAEVSGYPWKLVERSQMQGVSV